jgi:glycogen operon protein
MISGGDEVGRTQWGNNNAYCQDGPLSWTPWRLDQEQRDLLAFVQSLAALRASEPVLQRRTFLRGRLPETTDVLWLREDGAEMSGTDWHEPHRHVLGMLLDGEGILERDGRGEPIRGNTLLILFNGGTDDQICTLPTRGRSNATWDLVIDTAAADTRQPARVRGGTDWTLRRHSATIFRLRHD